MDKQADFWLYFGHRNRGMPLMQLPCCGLTDSRHHLQHCDWIVKCVPGCGARKANT